MSNYEELNKEIFKSVREIYGSQTEIKYKTTKLDSSFWSPYLNIDKYQDPTGAVNLYYRTYIECFKKQKNEPERLRKEIEERKIFEREKAEYQRWLDRKHKYEKHHKTPFLETCPRVSDKVKNLFMKQQQEALQQKIEKDLNDNRNNGHHNNIIDSRKNKVDKKPEETIRRPPSPLSLLPPPPPPPPPLPVQSVSPIPPPPILNPFEPIASSSTDTRKNPNAFSNNISEAKKRDLDLFGDDEEFSRLDPVNIINNQTSQPHIDSPAINQTNHKSKKKKRSRSKSLSPIRSPKRHKKEKKEKKEKKKEQDKRHEDLNNSITSESERSRHHHHQKHKKHKKQDKDYK